MNVSRGRTQRLGFLLSSRDLERRDAGGQPDRARGEAANDVAEEVQTQIHPAIADSGNEHRTEHDHRGTPESVIR
jgi:hypothetical protein